MANVEKRVDSMLGQPAPAEMMPLTVGDMEPMPAEMMQQSPETEAELLTQDGTPSMEEPVQVAGIGSVARSILRKAAPKAERPLVQEGVEAVTEGGFKVIPEATEQVTRDVGAAVKARAQTAPLQAKPPVEPFNLSRFQTDDVSAVVAGVADSLGIKTTKVTFEEIRAKAAESGISESFLARLTSPDGKMLPNAVETYKALQVLESSATELDKLFKLVDSGNATDIDKLKLRQQIAFHGMIQKGVKGIQTETARALAVFRIPRDNTNAIAQVLDEFGGDKSLRDLARSYLTLDTRAAKNNLVEKSMMSGLKDIWFTTYINGLLSSPVTHAKNIVGNLAFGLYQIPERFVGAMYSKFMPDSARSWKSIIPGSEKDKIEFDEALTMIQALPNGFLEGLQMGSKAFKENTPSGLMSKIEDSRGMREGLGEQLQRVTGASADSMLGKGLDYYATAVTLPGRALMTEDEFFKGMFYRMELNAQIIRRGKTVYRDAIEAGMPENQALAKMEAEVTNLYSNPPADLDELATQFSQNTTFTNELPPALKWMQKVFNVPAAKIIVPFFKTPANIGLNVVERTPFAPVSSRWRNEIAKGGVYRDMALAKVTMGTGLLVTFGALAADGQITGSGPVRDEEREALMRTGWKPYSIKVGDTWYSYAGMEPLSAFLAIAADYGEYAQREEDDSKVEEVALGLSIGLLEYLKEQPYLQGLSDISKLFGMGKGAAQEIEAKKILDGLAKQGGGFVIGGSPAGAYSSSLAAIERLSNPNATNTQANPDLPMGVRGAVEAFNQYKSRIPYFNADLEQSLNLWAEPIKQGQGAAYELILPTRVSKDQFSQVDDMLALLGGPIGMPNKKIDGIEMTSQQYNRMLTIYAKELGAKDILLETMSDPAFDMLSLKDQQLHVQKVHSEIMGNAKKIMLNEFPELQQKIFNLEEMRNPRGLYYKPQ